MSSAVARREPFFLVFGWVILATVVLCFGAKALFDSKDLPPITPLHHVHALSMLAWFLLFALQPTLLQLGRQDLHRWLGRLSPLLVGLFYLYSVQISMLNWQRMGVPLIPTANAVNLLLFALLYLAALGWRRQAAIHKRLMLFATLSLMGPAFGRLPEIFDASPFLAVPLILGFQLAPLVHDKWVHGRVHAASWIGFALLLSAVPLIIGLSGSPAWAAQLETLLGPRGGS